MTKITSKQFTDSFLLTLVSRGPTGNGKRLIDKILETVSEQIPTDAAIFDVKIMVNDVELDFNEYVDRINESLEDLVTRAAEKLFKEQTENLRESLNRLIEQVDDVTVTFEQAARMSLGLPKEED